MEIKMTTEDSPIDSFDGVKAPDEDDTEQKARGVCSPCGETEINDASGLTTGVSSGTSGVTTGDDSMSDDLEQGIKLIRQAFAAEGKRAVDEFVTNLQSSIGGTKADIIGPKRVTRHPSAEKSVRAPAGSARVLCKRALSEAKNSGMTVMKIQNKALGEYERMLSTSAIRNELATGERLDPPIYKQVGGVWYLTDFAPATMRIVSGN